MCASHTTILTSFSDHCFLVFKRPFNIFSDLYLTLTIDYSWHYTF